MKTWLFAWLIVICSGLAILTVTLALFSLLAGREGPPRLRGVKRWIEGRPRS